MIIKHFISHNYSKIKFDSCDSLPLEKTLAFHNAIILIKSVWKKDQNHCYYNMSLKKCSYQLSKNNDSK